MNKGLNNKMKIAIITGVLATSLSVSPHYANAIGSADKVSLMNQFKTENVFKFPLPFEMLYQASLQPKQLTIAPQLSLGEEIEKEKLEQRRIKEEREAEVREERLNFLKMVEKKDITKINLRTPSGLTADEINVTLDGTHLAGLGEAFYKAEQKHKVNAYYLMAHAAWESAWGESKLAKSKNNLFGFAAYDSSPYKSAMTFKTKGDCILTVAEFISTHYLEEDGDHFSGANLKGMNVKYASDKKWADGIASVIVTLVDKSEKNKEQANTL